MTRRIKKIGGVGGAIVLVLAAGYSALFHSIPVGDVYPNPELTPGAADTLDVGDLNRRYDGKTYSQSHRKVSEFTKRQVYKNAGVPYPQKPGRYEVDHFWPLCAGGSNDIKNLWLEGSMVRFKGKDYGFHQKDLLEALICRKIRDGSISSEELRSLFERFVIDWVRLYEEMGLGEEDKELKKLGMVPGLVE